MGPWNPVHAGKNAVTLLVTPLKRGSTPATAGKNAATLPNYTQAIYRGSVIYGTTLLRMDRFFFSE